MEEVYLLLGSNKGDRERFLYEAINRIEELCSEKAIVSRIYESEPWGFDSKTWFLNIALKICTGIEPRQLLIKLLEIERDLGRVRSENANGYESREIDIDIIFYGNRIINEETLIIPHPRAHIRRFVLAPLCEISPDYIHPVLGEDLKTLLKNCSDHSLVSRHSATV
jgi:2-amino-4-hydroxy-6-hydroxymethyldihydropteridine diphosphokinase